MTCPPGRFCPDHAIEPGALVLAAITLAAIALVCALVLAATGIHALIRRTRLRSRARNAGAYAREASSTRQYEWPSPDGRKE